MDFKEYFKLNSVNLSDKEKIAIKVGGLITSARLYSRLSQAELAGKIGTKQPSVARAEKGEMIASIEFLYKIAKALNTEFIFPKFGFMEDREKTSNMHIRLVVNENNNSNLWSISRSNSYAPSPVEEGQQYRVLTKTYN